MLISPYCESVPCALDSCKTNLADFHNYYNLIINPVSVGYAVGTEVTGLWER